MSCEIYRYDLKNLYEQSFRGSREAGMLLNNILTFKTDYGDFVSADDLLKANDMLRKCENALSLADVSEQFKIMSMESIAYSYKKLEALWKDYTKL